MKKNPNLEKIKTVDDAFEATGRPKVDFSNVPEDLREHFEKYYKGIVITESLNKGWKPDWENWSERKWRPWFVMSASAFGLDDTYCAYAGSNAGSGSRLQNIDEETAIYSATQFLEIWKGIQLG